MKIRYISKLALSCSRKYFEGHQNQEGLHLFGPFHATILGSCYLGILAQLPTLMFVCPSDDGHPTYGQARLPVSLLSGLQIPPSVHFWSQVIRYRIQLISVADDRCQQVSDQVATLIWKYRLVTKSCLHFCPLRRGNPQFGDWGFQNADQQKELLALLRYCRSTFTQVQWQKQQSCHRMAK